MKETLALTQACWTTEWASRVGDYVSGPCVKGHVAFRRRGMHRGPAKEPLERNPREDVKGANYIPSNLLLGCKKRSDLEGWPWHGAADPHRRLPAGKESSATKEVIV